MMEDKTHVREKWNQKIAEKQAEIVFPEKGMVVHLGGLSYQVRYFSRRTGELRLAMIKPEMQSEE